MLLFTDVLLPGMRRADAEGGALAADVPPDCIAPARTGADAPFLAAD